MVLKGLRQSEGFLFLLILIFKSLAARAEQEEKYLAKLKEMENFFGAEGRIKYLLSLDHIKALTFSQ